MSIINKLGSFTGKSAAYIVDGTRLNATQFAQGAKQGYADKSAELKARRAAVLAGLEFVPMQQQANKLAVH